MGQGGRGDNGTVGDANAVVDFVPFLETSQDRNRIFTGRLADVDRLEPAFQGWVFLDALAIFIEGGGSDTPKLAASEGRFQHIRSVHRPFGRAGADQGVEFIDEENDLSASLGNFL